jgi:signal peptide peptidase SppA
MKALDLAQAVPWAIRPEALQLILEIAAREHVADFEAVAARVEARRRALETDAVSTGSGERLAGTRTVVMRGDTAVVPIEGPITRYANLFNDISGGTSIEMLAKDFSTALADPAVKAILLHVDSPGGEVSGTGELTDIVYAARGQKPITAYVSHQGASAAYWIASAADQIVIAPTAIVGSIGVIATVPDPKRQPGEDFQFISSQSPKKRPDPATKDGKAQIQTVVDDLAEVFVGSVARNRGVDVQTVLDTYGAGDVMVGDRAVQAGLADSIGSFEQVLSDLNAPPPAPEPPAPVQPARPARKVTPSMNAIGSRFDRLMAFLGAPVDAEAEDADMTAETPPVSVAPVPAITARVAPQQGDTPEVAALKRRLEASESENARIRAERIAELASSFATVQITAGRAFPAESAQIVALFTQCASDDSNLGPVRQADGSTSTRVAALTAAYEARPSHNLTKEQLAVTQTHQALSVLANLKETPGTGDREPTHEEIEKLLAMTPGGRATLAARRNGGN